MEELLEGRTLASLDEAYRLLFVVSEHLKDANAAERQTQPATGVLPTTAAYSDAVNLWVDVGELRREVRARRFA